MRFTYEQVLKSHRNSSESLRLRRTWLQIPTQSLKNVAVSQINVSPLYRCDYLTLPGVPIQHVILHDRQNNKPVM